MASEDRIREDYYAILHVPQHSSTEEIRESYKKLALKCHPDKNQSLKATEIFQTILRAWECLRDEGKRREYDRNYWVVKIGLGVGSNVGSAAGAGGSGKRKWEWDWEESDGWNEGWAGKAASADEARRRREGVDRDAGRNFKDEADGDAKQSFRRRAARADTNRRARARAWKVMARQDYQQRLAKWNEKRRADMELINQCEQDLSTYQRDLENQMRESDQQITKRFHETIGQIRRAGAQVKDEHLMLKKILDGRKAYASKLVRAIAATKSRLQILRDDMHRSRKQYEDSEAKARQDRIREALAILGPRDLKSPLFSMIDRRGQAINMWKTLARVRAAVKATDNAKFAEGPWHVDGLWKRVVGEQTCGSCQQSSFQVIPDFAAAECPGCGMLACNACWRDLCLLREYSGWLTSSETDMKDSLFSLEFDKNDRVKEFDNTPAFNDFGLGAFASPHI